MSNQQTSQPIQPLNPSPHFNLSDGRELKMTYGLQNRLAKLIQNVSTVSLILTDVQVQEAVIANLFNKYDGKGQVIEEANFEEIMFNPVEIQHLLLWVTEHLTNFFLLNLQSMTRIAVEYQKGVESSLEPLSSGTKV